MLSARHWDVTNLTKPIRALDAPTFLLLLALAALSGCAYTPPNSHGRTAEALVTSPCPAQWRRAGRRSGRRGRIECGGQ